ncbi:MAG: response regulator [Bacteroidota bacterium]
MSSKKFPSKILLIDDDEDEYFIFSDIIKNLDDNIELNYLSGPAEIQPHTDFSKPDILFLDINMPTWNGFDWLNWIREKGHDFPVIMYSTSKNPDVVRRAYGAGAHLYLNKPMEFHELVSSVSYILQLDWTRPTSIRGQHIDRRDYPEHIMAG